MDFKELVYRNRSVRRFDGARALTQQELHALADLGRMCPNGMNLQWVQYACVSSQEMRTRVNATLGWAAYYKDWDGPSPEEQPGGFIVLVEDARLGKGSVHDSGIIAQTILLAAVSQGLAGCILANINRPELSQLLGLHEEQHISLVIALGRGVEEVRVVPMPADGNYKYFRDGDTQCVPKRELRDVLIAIPGE